MLNNSFILQSLKEIGISQNILNQLLIRSTKSKLIKNLFENIQHIQQNNTNLINIILESLITADRFSLITCNKKTLSKITGLSERVIDNERRAGNIPHIQLTGTKDERGGRKAIIFDPFEVMQYLNENKRFKIEIKN